MTSLNEWASGLASQPPIPVGWEPIQISAWFSWGQDWIATINADDDTFVWPTGTTATLSCYAPGADTTQPPSTWTSLFVQSGVVSGASIYFKVEAINADKAAAGSLVRITLAIPNVAEGDDDDYTWAVGVVNRSA